VVRIVDKLHKIGADGVRRELIQGEGIEGNIVENILSWAKLRCSVVEAEEMLKGVGISNETFQKGVGELLEVVSLVPESLRQILWVDLSLARGLDYYTGTIFEVVLPDYPAFGSVSAGGRYDDLTAQFIPGQRLPAVGGSIGVTRLMGLILEQRLYPVGPQCPTQILFTIYSEESRIRTNEISEQFRSRGVATEVYFKAAKLGKQIEYANSKGIRFCAFLNEESGVLEIKDLVEQKQGIVGDVDLWIDENRGLIQVLAR
jgi:histidyl-tRNA synthetase